MKNKKVVWLIIGIVSVALIALAITYAYWQLTKTQQGVNEITAACLDISLADAESGNTGVSLQDQYPLSDTEGAALKPYKFTVTNNCDTKVDYQIALESIGDSTNALSPSSLKVMLDSKTSLLSSNETLTPTVSGAYATHKLGMGSLAATGGSGASVTHELRLWIDEDAPVEENNKTYAGKITVTIGQGVSASTFKEGTMAYTLLEAYGGESSITEINDVSSDETEAVMYKTADDYGISYYFRGDVIDNYVKFGEYSEKKGFVLYLDEMCYHEDYCEGNFDYMDSSFNSLDACESYGMNTYGNVKYYRCVEETLIPEGAPMYWRVVRINGDGTIRMIYDGRNKLENGACSGDTSLIGTSYYDNEFDENKRYVGYMYGTEDDPYGDNPETVLTDSDIKRTLDTWYTEYLKTNYEEFIADSIFCNDREEYEIYDDGHTTYNPSNRFDTATPILTCNNKRDRFTVDDTTLGNGHLTNPIGLITVDEIQFAGYDGYRSNYLDNCGAYWTSSPANSIGELYVFAVSNFQVVLGERIGLGGYELGVRPVINLKADVDFTIAEDGTYVITTD